MTSHRKRQLDQAYQTKATFGTQRGLLLFAVAAARRSNLRIILCYYRLCLSKQHALFMPVSAPVEFRGSEHTNTRLRFTA